MDIITKIVLILNIFAFIIILRQLYGVSYHGKIIINANKNRFLAIFFAGVIIIGCCILGYLYMQRSYDLFYILLTILWIEIVISKLIRFLHSSEIRENGVYGTGTFYKWSKVQSYSWILPTTIQFEVNTFFKTNYSFEFTIKEELKLKVNETVQKYVL
jgi:thiosulfate dehydrogenase [quinone] large subunit